jgi:TatD DNase family protein
VHCFTGSLDECRAYVDLGCHIGLTGFICDEREGRGAHLAEVAAAIPLDRLLIETDGPYVLPRNIPRAVQRTAVVSGRCEPWMVVYVLQKLAQLRGVDTPAGLAALAEALHANTVRVFRLDRKHDEATDAATAAADDNSEQE